MAGEKGKRGGRKKGAGRKKGDGGRHGPIDAKAFMNAMVVAGQRQDHDPEQAEQETVRPGEGFGEINLNPVDPVDFCLAVINNDRTVLNGCGVIEIPSLDQKLFAARVAVKFTNKPKPAEVISKHQFSWVDEISAAEQRVRDLRKNVNDDPTRTVN